MDADKINDFIDDAGRIGENGLESLIQNQAAMAILGVSAGFWSLILGKVVSFLLKKAVFPTLRSLKREGQEEIDILDGEIFIKKKEEATQNEDENAIVDLITDL